MSLGHPQRRHVPAAASALLLAASAAGLLAQALGVGPGRPAASLGLASHVVGLALAALVLATLLGSGRGRAAGGPAEAGADGPASASELARREGESRFRDIVDQSPLSIMVFSREGRVLHVNDAHLALWGVPRGKAESFEAFDDPQLEALGLLPVFRRALAGERISVPPLEYDLGATFGQGRRRWVRAEFYPTKGPGGEVESLILMHEDVTDRILAEAEIRRLNQELEGRVEERTTELRDANRELEGALAGLKEAQSRLVLAGKLAALGQLVAGIAHELNSPLGAIASSAETAYAGLGGHLLPFADSYNALRDSDRPLIAGLARRAFADIGAVGAEEGRRRRALEAGLEAAGIPDGLSLAAELAPVVDEQSAAEAALLASTREGLDCLRALAGLAPAVQAAAIVRRGVERASAVVDALRTYASEGRAAGAVEAVDVGAQLRTLLALNAVKLAGRVEVATSLEPGSTALGRPEELHQVWLNLLENAFEAIGYSGRIAISTESRGGLLAVSFEDDGPGIGPEIGQRVFEPFFTTKAAGEGTGLGLDIARRIAEAHGGSIGFESRPGRTVFTVLLPRP